MSFFFNLKTNFLVDAILLIVIGLVLIFLPGTTLTLLTKVIGGLVLFAGAVAIISGILSKKQNVFTKNGSLVAGIVIAVVGIWILMNPQTFESIIPVIAGVIVVFSGIANLGEALSLGKSNYGHWWIALILAVLTILVGAFLLFRPLTALSYVVQVIGAALVYNGASNLWIVSRMHKVEKVNKAEVIDVESKEL